MGCTSTRHSEYDCMIRYSVSSGRFTRDKWCQPCQDRYTERATQHGDESVSEAQG